MVSTGVVSAEVVNIGVVGAGVVSAEDVSAWVVSAGLAGAVVVSTGIIVGAGVVSAPDTLRVDPKMMCNMQRHRFQNDWLHTYLASSPSPPKSSLPCLPMLCLPTGWSSKRSSRNWPVSTLLLSWRRQTVRLNWRKRRGQLAISHHRTPPVEPTWQRHWRPSHGAGPREGS